MPAQIIDGRKISAEVTEELKEQVAKLKDEYGVQPGIAVVIIGDASICSISSRVIRVLRLSSIVFICFGSKV